MVCNVARSGLMHRLVRQTKVFAPLPLRKNSIKESAIKKMRMERKKRNEIDPMYTTIQLPLPIWMCVVTHCNLWAVLFGRFAVVVSQKLFNWIANHFYKLTFYNVGRFLDRLPLCLWRKLIFFSKFILLIVKYLIDGLLALKNTKTIFQQLVFYNYWSQT